MPSLQADATSPPSVDAVLVDGTSVYPGIEFSDSPLLFVREDITATPSPITPRVSSVSTPASLSLPFVDAVSNVGVSVLPGIEVSDSPLLSVPEDITSKSCVYQSTVAVELQADVGPDSHHSPLFSPVKSLPSAYSDDKRNLEKFVLKDPIDWPSANDADAWSKLENQVFKELPREGSVEERLSSLEDGIYSQGLNLFGVKTFNVGPKKSRQRSAKKTMQLVSEKITHLEVILKGVFIGNQLNGFL